MLLTSCLSIPGEKAVEKKKLAADYYDLAVGYVEAKKYDKAITCFEKAREKADKQDVLKIDYQIARTYALSNKWEKSCSLFLELLENDPDNASLKEAYAYTLYKTGMKDEALELYEELCAVYPGDERISKNYEALKKEKEAPVEEPPEPSEDSDETSEETDESDSLETEEMIPGVSA